MTPEPTAPDVAVTLTAQEAKDWLSVARDCQNLARLLADRQNANRLRFTGKECTDLVTALISAGNLIQHKLAPPPPQESPCPSPNPNPTSGPSPTCPTPSNSSES